MATAQQFRDHTKAAQFIQAGRFLEAEPLMEGIKTAFAMDPVFLFNYATMLLFTKRETQAIRTYRQCIAINPNFVPGLVNLSNALLAKGEMRESLRYLNMAIRLQPNDHRLIANLASLLNSLGEGPHAWEAAQNAYQLAPTDFQVASVRMQIAHSLKIMDGFDSMCRLTIETNKGPPDCLPYILLSDFYSHFSRWDDLDRLFKEWLSILTPTNGPLPTVNVSPMSLAFNFDSIELVRRCNSPTKNKVPVSARQRPLLKQSHSRISIGYLSPDLREHPVAQMLLPILRQHDRSKFRICAISTLPVFETPLSKEIAELTDLVLDTSQMDATESAAAIRNANIDILVDLAGDTEWNRSGILSIRPAPVQVLWLGCPSTTRHPWYDAFFVDSIVLTPEYRRVCSEPLVDLPMCYHPITIGPIEPAAEISRKDFGLPDGVFILGLLQLPAKIRPPFLDSVVEILRAAPNIVLWLRARNNCTDTIRTFFASAGIHPNRLYFLTQKLPRPEYLATFTVPDLLIDSFPYGGHSTTGEALSMGCPVVTRAGTCMHTRVAASMLHQLGLTDLISYSQQEYVAKVVTLCKDSDLLKDVRQRTQAAATRERALACKPLTRALEQAYTDLVAAAPC